MCINDYDRWVVRSGNVYLVAVAYEDTGVCRFSENIYDAARFEDVNVALQIAKRARGEIVRFNSITGKIGI